MPKSHSFRSEYEEANALKSINFIYLPLELSKLERFFDFSGILGNYFGFEFQGAGQKPKIPKGKDLSKNEKKVLSVLVEYPEATGSEIAERAKLSEVTVSSVKHKLFKENILHPVVVPDLKKLGFELLVFNHFQFTVGTGKENANKAIDFFRGSECSFIMAYGSRECAVLCVFRDYSEYKRKREKYEEALEDYKILVKDHEEVIISLQDRKFEKLDFFPLVKKLLTL